LFAGEDELKENNRKISISILEKGFKQSPCILYGEGCVAAGGVLAGAMDTVVFVSEVFEG